MKKFLLILLVGIVSLPLVLTGCGTPKTALELDKKNAAGIWVETVDGSGNIEMSEDGSIRIFDALQTNEIKGTWDMPKIGFIDIAIEGSPAANLGYKFEDDNMSIWPVGNEEQPLTYKKATQKDINEMQKKAKDYADKIKENNEKANGQRNEEPMEKEELSMKQEEAKKDKRIVVFETNVGNLELAVYPKVAPVTVKNFLDLVESGFYDGIIFHRVIPQFMIQTGGITADGSAKPSIASFKDEINPDILGVEKAITQENERKGYQYDYTLPSLPMAYGTLAMANAGPNTNSSQIFIVTKFDGCTWLDGLHTVFGECISGMDVALKIQNVQTGPQDKPIENIVITKAYIKE